MLERRSQHQENMSRSTWACELKFCNISMHNKTADVTLHVSVWVEMRVAVMSSSPRLVTLHVSVWVEMPISPLSVMYGESRSTWACELKCQACHTAPVDPSVTLHVSVWVEIAHIWHDTVCAERHAPRERVSWNSLWSLSVHSCCRHAPRERVSWNNCSPITIIQIYGHAPRERVSWNAWRRTWQRRDRRHAPRERVSWNVIGFNRLMKYKVTLHVSVWVEMIIVNSQSSAIKVTLHVSVWVEIGDFGDYTMTMFSHAPRERVSWNLNSRPTSQGHYVTLHVSVWVEIVFKKW